MHRATASPPRTSPNSVMPAPLSGSRSQPSPRALASVLLALGLLLGGCGGGSEGPRERQEGEPLRIVTTIGMITDLVERVGGDRVQVQGLMGPGVDPHLYRAGAGDLRALAGADLILYNGLFLEAALGEVLAEMGGRIRTEAVTAVVPREALLFPAEFEGAPDPHLWSDVSLWRAVAGGILEVLEEMDPEGAEGFRERHRALDAELEALDHWVREEVARLPPERRVLVTAHDAFHYFADAYGIEASEAIEGISTTTEASIADIRAVADFVVERQVPAVFVETTVNPRTIEALVQEVRARGHAVEIGGELFSDGMGEQGTAEGTYIGMLRANTETVVGALGGELPEWPEALADWAEEWSVSQ
jgi:manganese/zinc/iron transport system substrate-binding protein